MTPAADPHWTYHQSTGHLIDPAGNLLCTGYSGKARGRNNPKLQGVPGIGPIPQGLWRIGDLYNSANVGKNALRLHAVDATPVDDRHDATGRSAFRMHGDSIRAPGTASRGCIIAPLDTRLKVARSAVRLLQVVA